MGKYVENFAKILSKSEKARQNDKLIFESFKKDHITAKECWEQFLENNHCNPEEYDFDENTKVRFIRWLRGLGYTIRTK